LTGLCFSVHNELGSYAREKKYADQLEKKLEEAKIIYIRELEVGNSGNRVDFLIDNKIVLELKAKRLINKEDYKQIQNYLQEMDIKLGILVNFRGKFLKPYRVVKIDRF
jgi:GxxExxY protein